MATDGGSTTDTSWAMAIGTSVGLAVVGCVALIVVPHLLVTRMWTEARGAREAAAIAWFAISFTGILVLLRALQDRGRLG
jgi:hypothetical protein